MFTGIFCVQALYELEISRISAWTFSWALNDNVRVAASIAGVAVGFTIASADWVILISAKALVALK